MKSIPGTLREGGAAFEPTHWSIVLLAAESSSPAAAQGALAELYQAYWPPLYSFVRRRGYGSAEAQDLTQSFFVHLVENQTFARADPGKGKFRSFLLGALKRFLADAQTREQTLKRGGAYGFVTLDDERLLAEAQALGDARAVDVGEDRLFEQRWAAALVTQALARLRTESEADGRPELFETLLPLVTGVPPLPDHAALAAQFGLPAVTLRSRLHRMRERYREVLRAGIARTVSTRGEIDDELRHLCRVLIATG